MRAKKAKAIKKEVYGDYSPRDRRYRKNNGVVEADPKRQRYQDLKKIYKKGVKF